MLRRTVSKCITVQSGGNWREQYMMADGWQLQSRVSTWRIHNMDEWSQIRRSSTIHGELCTLQWWWQNSNRTSTVRLTVLAVLQPDSDLPVLDEAPVHDHDAPVLSSAVCSCTHCVKRSSAAKIRRQLLHVSNISMLTSPSSNTVMLRTLKQCKLIA